jgi:Spy/CpxP family protein refolding chaperone
MDVGCSAILKESKMKRRETSTGIAISLLILCFGGPGVCADETDAVSGASPATGHDYHAAWQSKQGQPHEMMTRWSDELGLSAQQTSDMQIITADYATRFRDLAQLGRETARDLLETPPDDAGYQQKTQNASALAASSAAELVTLLAEMRAKLYSVLTPEQRERFHALLQTHRDKEEQTSVQ